MSTAYTTYLYRRTLCPPGGSTVARSDLVRRVRKAHGYTQQEMAEELDVTRGMVEAMEERCRLPRDKTVLEKLLAMAEEKEIEVEE